MNRPALLATTIAIALVLSSGAHARAPQAAPPKPPADQAAPKPPARNAPQLVNVRMELTLTEEGEGAAAPKTVTVLVADQHNGRIRTGGPDAGALNVDARPEVLGDGRLRVNFSLEYRPDGNAGLLSQSLSALLVSGKPLLVSQSAHPRSDRRVRAELTATIVK